MRYIEEFKMKLEESYGRDHMVILREKCEKVKGDDISYGVYLYGFEKYTNLTDICSEDFVMMPIEYYGVIDWDGELLEHEVYSGGWSFGSLEVYPFNPFFDDFDSKFMPAVVSVIDSYCSFLEQDYVLLNEKIENGWLFPSYIEKIGVERTVNKCSANLVQLCTY